MDDQFLNRDVVIRILKSTVYSRDAMQLVREMPTVGIIRKCESCDGNCLSNSDNENRNT